MKELGSDAVIEIVPGDRLTMWTPESSKRVDEEMAARFLDVYRVTTSN